MPVATAPTATCVIPQTHLTDLPPFPSVFDPARPVEVDIGCGKGRFLLARAAANPNVQYLGIERLLLRVRKIDRRVQRGGLTNVHLIRLEAGYTLRYFLPSHSVRCFYLFFPDPWPKRRHHKRRLFDALFRTLVWSRLEPGGEIQIATDHLDYFADMEKALAADPRFEAVPAIARTREEQTDFELIFRAQQLPIVACGFRARPASALAPALLARLAAEGVPALPPQPDEGTS
ncbi:MAG: tRNA (guanosine(46)-N7)-methyltransferase TrmB [Lentisphaerae bacterium]|nr:tRNA (guanosine(46)-N7)-methyltransferase TrmB [Lentisphaerota bacterium]